MEGGKAITMLFGKHIASIKCCPICPWIVIASGGAARLTAPDRGILALTGLLAVDKASMDMVYALPEVRAAIWWSAWNPAAACASWSIGRYRA